MTTLQPVPEVFVQALREMGLIGPQPVRGVPLVGGVSSDIWRIDTANGPICAKRALPKLRVAAEWHAPIERNLYEARWLQAAHQAQPGCVPQLLGQHARLGVLAMAYLPQHAQWKQQLREGLADAQLARAVGLTLARIHAWSAARPALAHEFPSASIFFDIRLEPYLLATARRHPDLAARLEALVRQTQAHTLALVHGDVSPKNILVDVAGPVFVDAECAVWGDPAFDLAFCLNHLLLKCLWVSAAVDALLQCFEALADTYLAGVDWEPPDVLQRRAAHLLPGLLLARVDGKSPVEYLSDDGQRQTVRCVARRLLFEPVHRLRDVALAWRQALPA